MVIFMECACKERKWMCVKSILARFGEMLRKTNRNLHNLSAILTAHFNIYLYYLLFHCDWVEFTEKILSLD